MFKGIIENQEALEALCKKYGVTELALFGSALSTDFDVERSDLDFLATFKPMPPIDYKRAYFAFLEEVESLFARHIDLVTPSAIRNPYLKASIEETKKLIYATQS